MNIWKSIAGQVVLQLTSADIPGALTAVTGAGIGILHSEPVDELTILLTVDRRHIPAIRALMEKRGEKLSVTGKKGIFWAVAAVSGRPVLLMGVLLILLLTFLLPTRILFIRVEGNESLPARQILAAAESCGIRFGASRSAVRSEKVKNALLAAVPGLQWAGVNTQGCVATISVRERAMEQSHSQARNVSSLAAIREGIILSCTVTAGTGQCIPGQAVQAGQVLISGYTDCGPVLKATRAEGEIFAQTRRHLTAVALSRGFYPEETGEVQKSYSLILGKKRINFANSSRICDATCGRMYKEYCITLPGGFVLPVVLAVQTHICRTAEPFPGDPGQLLDALTEFSRNYLQQTMVSGRIDSAETAFYPGEETAVLETDCLCREMIGKRVQERKVEMNGESD